MAAQIPAARRVTDSPPTILVIDNEPAVRGVIRRFLQPSGFDVVEAGDGLSGLQIVDSGRPFIDAVVADLDLPLLDGFDLAELLVAYRPNLPVVVVAARPIPEGDLERLRGVLAVLEKPFASAQLTAALASVLRSAHALRARARRVRNGALESRVLAVQMRELAAVARERSAHLMSKAMELLLRRQGPT